MSNDGCILDRLVMALRHDGPTLAIEDSAPRDLYRRALRIARYGSVGGSKARLGMIWTDAKGWHWPS